MDTQARVTQRRSFGIAARVSVLVLLPILAAVVSAVVGVRLLSFAADTSERVMLHQRDGERAVAEWRALTRLGLERAIVIANTQDADLVKRLIERNDEGSAQIDALVRQVGSYAKADPARERALEAVAAKRRHYLAVRTELYKSRASWSAEELRRYSETQFMPAVQAYADAQREFAEALAVEGKEGAAQIATGYASGRNLIVALALMTAALSGLLGWWLARSLTRPARRAVEAAEAIADGDIDVTIEPGADDEVGRLMRSMQRISDAIGSFRVEQQRMVDKHAQGAISYGMPADKFSGSYREMAESINALVKSHVDVKMTVVDLIGKYSRGDFSEQITPLPGEKGKVSDAIESVRQDLSKAADAAAMALSTNRALDVAATSLMLADAEHRVVYVNESARALMQQVEPDLRAVVPGFAAQRLTGVPIGQLCGQDVAGIHEARRIERLAGERTFTLMINPVVDAEGRRTGTVVEWHDRTEELRDAERERQRIEAERIVAAENLRIRKALDTCSTRVMIADAAGGIVYLNDSLQAMLVDAERDLRTELSQFDARRLVGQTLDAFNESPSLQRGLLAESHGAHGTEVQVGPRTFRIAVSVVRGDDGKPNGRVVEWQDRSAEVRAEQQVAQLVNAASEGNFEGRLDVHGMDGFMRQIGDGLNQVMSTSEAGLNDVARVLRAIAQGDLTERIDGEYHGTFGELKSYTNRTVEQLSRIVREIQEATGAIGTAAKEIAQGNTDLSTRTEQQAASLEETAASMEELTSTVRQNADNARQANQLAVGASDVAVRGGGVVSEVVQTMTGISESSRKIVDIIAVIDGIAFQTNILALNAAV
ncbi:MAG: methyl-accepting chemotaxis protein, partial [Burkholderiaceae bacterium]